MTAATAADPIADALRAALGSQYDMLGLLGRGGMGAVYRARETFLERDVAVKVLPGELASGDARERFLREARTAARLSHPNIVPLYTFGQAGELLYYVMGHVDGESLETRLRREGRLSLDDTRRILAELSDALEYAHQMGVVHRDVKPDNVLLDRRTGRAMLTDFGIAKQRAGLETLTQTGVIVGTPHYMSPEQASGDPDIDGRSDIYALGVIGYRMATGRLPFEGDSLRDVLAQHATRVPVAPTQLVPTLPVAVEHVIVRALAKDPAARWPSAGTLRDALSVDSEDSLPESLQNISGMGPRLGLIALGLLQLAVIGTRFGWMDAAMAWATIGGASFTFLAGFAGLIAPGKQHGWRAAWEQYWRQPAWWSTWWPRFARRPGDVWDRLPRDVRIVRMTTGAGMISNIALLNFMIVGMSEDMLVANPSVMKIVSWVAVAAIAGWMGVLVPTSRRFMKRAKAMGFTMPQIRQFFGGPTWGPFWQRPQVAALMSGAPAGATRGGSELPPDFVRQIDEVARAESGSAHATIYREAVSAANAIAAAIGALEKELGQLARDSDPREQERIQASLAALGPRDHAESAVKAQMRELLERQVSLFQDIGSQRERLAARRDHLIEQLRTLALHVAHLRSAASPVTAGDITGRIRSVCREIDYRIAGEHEVRAV